MPATELSSLALWYRRRSFAPSPIGPGDGAVLQRQFYLDRRETFNVLNGEFGVLVPGEGTEFQTPHCLPPLETLHVTIPKQLTKLEHWRPKAYELSLSMCTFNLCTLIPPLLVGGAN